MIQVGCYSTIDLLKYSIWLVAVSGSSSSSSSTSKEVVIVVVSVVVVAGVDRSGSK